MIIYEQFFFNPETIKYFINTGLFIVLSVTYELLSTMLFATDKLDIVTFLIDEIDIISSSHNFYKWVLIRSQ